VGSVNRRWWSGLLACTLGASSVRAEPGTTLSVRLVLDGCEQLDERETRRAFQAEIGARLSDEAGPLVTEARAACTDSRVELSIVDPLTRKRVRRRIDLSSTAPRGRERLVALAMAELLVASWAELEVNPNPRVEPEGPSPPTAATRAARGVLADRRQALASASEASRRPSRAETPPNEPPKPPVYDLSRVRNFRILAVVSARAFFAREGMLWGGGLRLGEERFRMVSWTLDSLIESGKLRGPSRAYLVDSATFGGTVAYFWRSRRVTARMGAGLRLGLIHSTVAAPQESAGRSSIGPWGWPQLVTSLSLFPGRGFAMELGAEVGYAVLAVSPGTNTGLNGTWYSAHLGMGFMP
jgi:hypothetical protein